jgi:hypothetical protein
VNDTSARIRELLKDGHALDSPEVLVQERIMQTLELELRVYWRTTPTIPPFTKSTPLPETRVANPPDGWIPPERYEAALKAWRKEKVKATYGQSPAYVFLLNADIMGIAATPPMQIWELYTVCGVNKWKAVKYGSEIMSVLTSVDGIDRSVQTPEPD